MRPFLAPRPASAAGAPLIHRASEHRAPDCELAALNSDVAIRDLRLVQAAASASSSDAMPPHAFMKSPAPPGLLSAGGAGEWSVAIMSSAPLSSPSHSA